MKRAIITGSTGAIGTALINELINNNIEVLVFTREDSKRNNNIPRDSLVTIEYCSLNELSKKNNDSGLEYDVFFHLAWEGASGPKRHDPETQRKNIEYAIDAVECANRFGCTKFIGVGSQAEYGRVETTLKPDTPCNPENEYGKAKLEAGFKTRERAHELGMQHNWIRVLSIYGKNDGENSLISYLVNRLRNNESPEVTMCEQTWDYLFSEDAASAIRMIAEKGIDGKTYVLGSGQPKKLKEYVEILKEHISPNTEVKYGAKPYPDKQVMYLVADISDITNDTGWTPTTSFEDGVNKMTQKDNKLDLMQFIKFGLVGVSNTAISLGVYYLFVFFNKKLYLIGSVVGFILSVLNSFYWNNKYVFKTEGQANWLNRLLKTYISYGGTTLLSTILLYLEVDVLHISEMIAPLVNMAITIPLNFLINKFWTYKTN